MERVPYDDKVESFRREDNVFGRRGNEMHVVRPGRRGLLAREPDHVRFLVDGPRLGEQATQDEAELAGSAGQVEQPARAIRTRAGREFSNEDSRVRQAISFIITGSPPVQVAPELMTLHTAIVAGPHSPRRNEGEFFMASRLNPYLNFNGDARQALEFYAGVFGGTPAFTTFADLGTADPPDANRIMHGMLETDLGFTIMGADVTSDMEFHPMAGASVSLSGDDGDALRDYWQKLSSGGMTTMPMQKQVWGDEFGMCVDRFGVPWLVNITQPQ